MKKEYVEYSKEECHAMQKFLLELVVRHPLKDRHWSLVPGLNYYLKTKRRYFGVVALSKVGKEHVGGSVALEMLPYYKHWRAEMDNLIMSVEDYLKEDKG